MSSSSNSKTQVSNGDTYSRTDLMGNHTPPRFDSECFQNSPFSNKNFPSEMIPTKNKMRKDKSTKSLYPRFSDSPG